MPGTATGISASAARRWGRRLERIVTSDGATIDFYGQGYNPDILDYNQLSIVDDEDLIRLLTPAVERSNAPYCSGLTDA